MERSLAAGSLVSLLKNAEQRLKQGDAEAAEVLLRQAWSLNPGHRAVALPLAKLLTGTGRGHEAEKILRQAIARAPDAALLCRLAGHQVRRGEAREAETLLRQAWSLDPGHRTPAIPLAKLLMDSGRGYEAEKVLRQAIARSSDAEVLGTLAEHRLKQGDAEDAEGLLRQAWSLNPGHRAVALPLAKLLTGTGRGSEAAEVLRQAIDSAPDAALLCRLAGHHVRQGEAREAETLLRQAWSLDPGHRTAAMPLAKLLTASGRGHEAEKVLRQAIARVPDAEVLGTLAEHRLKQGDAEDAEVLLRQAWSLNPGHRSGAVALARFLQAATRSHEGLAVLQSTLVASPNDAALLVEIGRYLARDERHREAQDAFTRASRMANAPASCWIQLSSVAARHDSMLKAITHLRCGLEIVGRNVELESSLAQRLLAYGLVGEAAEVLAQALEMFPTNSKLLIDAVKLDISVGRPSEQIQTLKHMVRTNLSLREETFLLRAQQLRARWQFAKARKVMSRLVRGANARIVDFHALAQIDMMMLDVDAARTSLRRAAGLRKPGERRNISQGLVGEVINDFSTDRLALSAAKSAQQSNSIESYVELARSFTHHTGSAISFFIHLRQNGKLETRDPVSIESNITPCIYQYWDSDEPPEDVASLMQSWIYLNPGWQHTLFSSRIAALYLKTRQDRGAYHAFRSASSVAGKSDILRLALLYDSGGVYADADDRCAMPLDSIVIGRELVVRQENFGSIGNNFVAVRAQHPVIGRALDHAIAAYLRGDRDSIWLSSGPGLLTRTLANYLAEDATRMDELGRSIRITDLHETRSFCISGCQAAYKASKRNWQRAEFGTTGTSSTASHATSFIPQRQPSLRQS